MRELNNFNEIPELFPWEPTFSKVIITLNTEDPNSDLILSNSTMSQEQYVVAVGPSAKQYFQVGDKVLIDLERMLVRERNPDNSMEVLERVKIDPIDHDGVTYAIIEDRLIKAKCKI